MPSNQFSPRGDTQTISATTSSSNVTIAGSGHTIRIASAAGSAIAFVKIATTAATTDLPILPGTVQYLARNTADVTVAGITGASTATLYVTPGDGGP